MILEAGSLSRTHNVLYTPELPAAFHLELVRLSDSRTQQNPTPQQTLLFLVPPPPGSNDEYAGRVSSQGALKPKP